jgi:leukotriene-A4 hydrolase
MENPRLTFVSPSLIAGNRDFDRVVAHELGHAWTGNLVTNATWDDFWLNEGWTTYIQQRIEEGVDDPELVSFSQRSAADQLSSEFRKLKRHPERTALKFAMEGLDPDDFSNVPYIKGAMFLRALEQAVGRDRWDRFARAYIKRYSFHSISTGVFLRFLNAQMPGIDRLVPLQSWIYHQGQPPGPRKARSKLYQQVHTVRSKYKQGVMPSHHEVREWNWRQVCLFLDTIPQATTLEQSIALEDAFSIHKTMNKAVLAYYYPHAIRAGQRDSLPRIRAYLEAQGMVFYLRPIYEALAQTEWSKDIARKLYEENKASYHPITQRIIENTLAENGVPTP